MMTPERREVEASTKEFFSILAPKLSPEQLDGFAKAAHYQALANEYMKRATAPSTKNKETA